MQGPRRRARASAKLPAARRKALRSRPSCVCVCLTPLPPLPPPHLLLPCQGWDLEPAHAHLTGLRPCSPKVAAIRAAAADLLYGGPPTPVTLALWRRGTAQRARCSNVLHAARASRMAHHAARAGRMVHHAARAMQH